MFYQRINDMKNTEPEHGICNNLISWIERNPDNYGEFIIRYDCQQGWHDVPYIERCIRELKKSSNQEYSTMELSFNPTMVSERQRMAKQAEQNVKDNFNSMDLENSYHSLFEVLWYTQLPCFDVRGITSNRQYDYGLLKLCIWKGFRVPCSKIFKTSPTEQGMCCTFNMEAAEEMFRKGPYSDAILELQKTDRTFAFDGNVELPDWWVSNKEPSSQPGKSKGLTLVLDAHSDTVASSSVTEDVDGFFAIVDSSNQFPMTRIKSALVRPGHNNLVAIKATKVASDPRIRAGATKEQRHCIFEDEFELELHTKYSQANCILERSMKYVMVKHMNTSDPCSPWYFPRTKKSLRICDPFEAYAFSSAMQNVPPNELADCFPDCDSTEYSVSVTAAPFRRCDHKNLGLSALCNFNETINPPIWGQSVIDQYMEEKGENPRYVKDRYNTNYRNFTRSEDETSEVFAAANRKKRQYDAYEKDVGMVTFFFETTTAYEFYRTPKLTWTDFISQCGGMMGLCLGFSLVSIFEIIYWFVFGTAKFSHGVNY